MRGSRPINRGVSHKDAHAALGACAFKFRNGADAGRETGDNTSKIVGYKVAAVAVRADSDKGGGWRQRMKLLDQPA